MVQRADGKNRGSVAAPASHPPVSSLGALHIAYEKDQVVIATWQNVTIVVWAAQATLPVVQEFGKISGRLLRSYQKVSNVQIIVDNAPMPTDEARLEFDRLTELGADRLACVAMVLAGSGFWTSAMRSYLTSVHWVKQRPFVPRIFTTLHEAAVGIPPVHVERSGVAIAAQALEEVLSTVQARVAHP
jgi:hypothetical protein